MTKSQTNIWIRGLETLILSSPQEKLDSVEQSSRKMLHQQTSVSSHQRMPQKT